MDEKILDSLVTIEQAVPLTTTYAMSDQLGIEHRSIMQLIKDHRDRIEKHFGFLRFENAEIDGPGRPEQFAKLTELQAYYLLTLSRNTNESMEIKALFVKAFALAKEQLVSRSPSMQLEHQIMQLQQNIEDLQRQVATLAQPQRLRAPRRPTKRSHTPQRSLPPEQLEQRIFLVMQRTNKPLTPAQLRGSYLKMAKTQEIATILEQAAQNGLVVKEITCHAPQGRFWTRRNG